MPALVRPVVPPGAIRRDAQPTLTVDELVIRPWEVVDAPAVAAAYSDPEIQRWHARTMTDQEALEWVQSWPKRWLAETGAGWAVVDAGVLVGRVGLGSFDLADGYGEAAYWVVPGARGRGIAARALAAVTEWAFEAGFHRIELLHSTENGASCRVAEKAGYAYEGTARSEALHADGWHDMHVHARVREEPQPFGPAHRQDEFAVSSRGGVDWPLRTGRLSLRPAETTDVDATWRFRQVDEVCRWMTGSPKTLEEYRTKFLDPQRLAKTLVIELDGLVIGDLMLAVEDAWAQAEVADQARGVQAELGWCLDPAHGGRGYATEAVTELVRMCFEDLGLRRVVANCFADNEASWRLMERLGMRRETYTIRESLHRSGKWLDGLGYALLADEWRAAQRA